MKQQPIAVQAIFFKATTTADGGWRVSFDISHNDSSKIADIAALNGQNINLVIMTSGYVSKTEPLVNNGGAA